MEITYEREFEDIADEDDVADMPAEWYDAAIMQLASRLCGPYGITGQRKMEVMGEARDALDMALAGDVEGSMYWRGKDG